jgi:hypothetical protein
LLILFREENGDELGIPALRVVEVLGDDMAFPCSAHSNLGRLLSIESPQVGFGARDKNKSRLLNLSFAR